MQIIWHGQSFFEIVAKTISGEVKIAIDPFGDDVGLKIPKAQADILIISHDHSDHNNVKAVSGDYFLIDSAGEYNIKDVFVQGIAAFHDDKSGKERGEVLISKIEVEDMTLCHLSDLGQKELTPEQIDAIGEIDILLIPVGGKFTVDAKDASEIVSQIEPKIVIPMHYKIDGLKLELDGIDKFLKVMGEEKIAPLPKLKVSTKDLPNDDDDETKIVVLEP